VLRREEAKFLIFGHLDAIVTLTALLRFHRVAQSGATQAENFVLWAEFNKIAAESNFLSD
jgi:hypothetical protein